MSLVPYQPQEGREIVLRHRNAIVVHDPTSQRLEIRGITLNECPTCHRPLRSASPERPHYGDDAGHGSHTRHEGFVDPNYFRLLRAGDFPGLSSLTGGGDGPAGGGGTAGDGGKNNTGGRPSQATGNPFRRLFQPLVGAGDDTDAGAGAEGRPEKNSVVSTPSESIGSNDHIASSDRGPSPPFADAEFVSSTPCVEPGNNSPSSSNNINKQAFSPNYFSTFFIEERELGRGGKGVVLLVRHEIDGCVLGHFACKRVPVGDDHAWLEKVLVEVELLAKLSHPNLVSYRHVWLENKKLNRFGPPVACAFILQQYCNAGDLHRFILGEQPKEATKEELKARMRRRSRGAGSITDQRPIDLRASIVSINDNSSSSASPSPAVGSDSYSPPSTGPALGSGPHRRLAFDEIYSLFKDITSGLAYLHAANYIHRDLKPSNCLLHRGEGRNGSSITCLISDFGEVQPENVVRKSTGTTGTISYCAPEVLRLDPATGLYGNFTTKSDVFSLGMILYFMCFGRLPYRSANSVNEDLEDVDELRVEISAWRGFQYERRVRLDLPAKLYELLTQMLSVNANERPSAGEVLLAMRTTTDSIGSNGGMFGGLSRTGSVSGGTGVGPTAPSSPSVKATATLSPPTILSGRRIENIDSPGPSSTPTPDPSKTKSSSFHSADLDESVIDDSDDLLPASTSFPRARRALRVSKQIKRTTPERLSTSTSLTLSRSHGSHSRSPERGQPMARNGGGSSRGSRGRHDQELGVGHDSDNSLSPIRGNHHAHAEEDPVIKTLASLPGASATNSAIATADDAFYSTPMTTPALLLMPPPTTFREALRHQALIVQDKTTMFLNQHPDSVSFAVRGILFMIKLVTLSRLCWPYMFQATVGAVLVAMAGLDLGMPRNQQQALHRHHQRQQSQSGQIYDWRVSVILLALHFAVLIAASRYGFLCAASLGEHVQGEEW